MNGIILYFSYAQFKMCAIFRLGAVLLQAISVQLGHKILIFCLINCDNQYHEFVLNGIYITLRKSSSIALPDNVNITQLTNDLVTNTSLGIVQIGLKKNLTYPPVNQRKILACTVSTMLHHLN